MMRTSVYSEPVPRSFIPVTDARTLRAVAHPMRGVLFYELMARGSARAADLARDLDVPANQVSFHLRLMAKYGLIEEAPERARDRRDRVWRPAAKYGFDVAPELAATPGYQQTARHHAHELVEAYFGEDRKGARFSRDIPMRLTLEEAEQLADEITQVMLRWAEQGRKPLKPEDERRETYLAQLYIQPLPQDRPPDQPPTGP
jgi:hypothetical protein